MLVRLLSGFEYEDLSPIRFDKSPFCAPTFWADRAADVIRRSFKRIAGFYGDYNCPSKPLRNNIKYSPVEFGWGDAGESNIVVYERVGTLAAECSGSQTTWTFSFYFGNVLKPAIKFVTPLSDYTMAEKIAIEALNL